MKTLALLVMLSVVCASLGAEPQAARLAVSERSTPLPQRLSETGLYVEGAVTTVRADHFAFSPQYPLWSDGTSKRRWIYLPPGTCGRCFARRCVGVSGRHASVEGVQLRPSRRDALHRATRRRLLALRDIHVERSRYRRCAGAGGRCGGAGQRRARWSLCRSSRSDCLACHEGPRCRCLASARCSSRPIAIRSRRTRSLRGTITRICRTSWRADWLRNLPRRYVEQPPRIAAASPTERAALGYLHGNCGHCHNDAGALTGLELVLAQQADAAAQSSERTMQSLLGHSSRFRAQGSRQRAARRA